MPHSQENFISHLDLIKLPSQSAMQQKSLGNQTSSDPVFLEVILTLWEFLCESKDTTAHLE